MGAANLSPYDARASETASSVAAIQTLAYLCGSITSLELTLLPEDGCPSSLRPVHKPLQAEWAPTDHVRTCMSVTSAGETPAACSLTRGHANVHAPVFEA